MENYKKNIANKLIEGNIYNSRVLQRIDDAIQYSWNEWDESIIASYYGGDEKPELPTSEFIIEWIENEDFEADGYDVEYLKELFS